MDQGAIDAYTARQAADLCGEIERRKVSCSRNETSDPSAFSFLAGEVIAADPGAVGKGTSSRRAHFTSLMVNQAIAKAFDGVRVLEPWVVYLKPMHENPELSWFDTTGRPVGERTVEPVAADRSRSFARAAPAPPGSPEASGASTFSRALFAPDGPQQEWWRWRQHRGGHYHEDRSRVGPGIHHRLSGQHELGAAPRFRVGAALRPQDPDSTESVSNGRNCT